MHEKYTYRVTWSDEDGEYIGLCAEFPNLSWLDKSQGDAFKGICNLVKDVLIDLKANNESIPEAIATKRFSGKLLVRVPPDLHRQLALEALEAHISLNRYLNAKLTAGHIIHP